MRRPPNRKLLALAAAVVLAAAGAAFSRTPLGAPPAALLAQQLGGS
jgi:hypothetical protein